MLEKQPITTRSECAPNLSQIQPFEASYLTAGAVHAATGGRGHRNSIAGVKDNGLWMSLYRGVGPRSRVPATPSKKREITVENASANKRIVHQCAQPLRSLLPSRIDGAAEASDLFGRPPALRMIAIVQ